MSDTHEELQTRLETQRLILQATTERLCEVEETLEHLLQSAHRLNRKTPVRDFDEVVERANYLLDTSWVRHRTTPRL